MMSVCHILRDSAELNRLRGRINATFLDRQLSKEHWSVWSDACKDFHSEFEHLVYPGGTVMLNRVRQQDPVALQTAVVFLLADPMHFRSGYLKEHLWRWLAHCPLRASELSQLERAALRYLDRTASREFFAMCKFMHRRGRDRFWSSVSTTLLSSDVAKVRRAELLLIPKGSLFAGAMARRRIMRNLAHERYGQI